MANIDKVAPSAVTGLAVAADRNLLTFAWEAATDDKSGIGGYEIEVSDDAEFNRLVASRQVSDELQYSLVLSQSGTYHYRVRAVDQAGNCSEWLTDTIDFEFVDMTPPTMPTGLAFAQDGTKFTFSWTASADAEAGVADYELTLVRNGHLETATAVEGTSVTLELAESNYGWSVVAKDHAGNVSERASGEEFKAVMPVEAPHAIALADGADLARGTVGDDVFGLAADGVWGTYNVARWNGGAETVSIAGRNRFHDALEGVGGYDVVSLPDGDNALLYRDLLSPSADGVEASARLAGISEIRGNGGSDVIDLTAASGCYAGDLLLTGGDGDDHLWAGSGDDVLIGGVGNDDLRGGAGNDLYLFGLESGQDKVVDDGGTLVFDSALQGKLAVSASGDGTVISDGQNTVSVSWQVRAGDLVFADVGELEGYRRDTIKAFLA